MPKAHIIEFEFGTLSKIKWNAFFILLLNTLYNLIISLFEKFSFFKTYKILLFDINIYLYLHYLKIK